MRIYVIGYSWNVLGMKIPWAQLVKDMEQAEMVKASWEKVGIQGIEIIER